MGYLMWIVFGGVCGWIGSIIMGNNSSQGIIGNVIVGIIGAYIGGYISNFLGISTTEGFNLPSIFFGVVGSVILIWVKLKLLH